LSAHSPQESDGTKLIFRAKPEQQQLAANWASGPRTKEPTPADIALPLFLAPKVPKCGKERQNGRPFTPIALNFPHGNNYARW